MSRICSKIKKKKRRERAYHTARGKKTDLLWQIFLYHFNCFNHKHKLFLSKIKNSTGLMSFLMFLILGMWGNLQSQRTVTWAILTVLHKLSHKSKARDSNSWNACRGISKEKLTNDTVDALNSKNSLVPFGGGLKTTISGSSTLCYQSPTGQPTPMSCPPGVNS